MSFWGNRLYFSKAESIITKVCGDQTVVINFLQEENTSKLNLNTIKEGK